MRMALQKQVAMNLITFFCVQNNSTLPNRLNECFKEKRDSYQCPNCCDINDRLAIAKRKIGPVDFVNYLFRSL